MLLYKIIIKLLQVLPTFPIQEVILRLLGIYLSFDFFNLQQLMSSLLKKAEYLVERS